MEKNGFIQKAIHKTLFYESKEEEAIVSSYIPSIKSTFFKNENKVKTLKYIEKHFNIPSDFEVNRKFGPKSGSCYEERVLGAYLNDLLETKDEKEPIKMCYSCAKYGHFPLYCPNFVPQS